jgi:photosystem II stability/assembly factor-like uncharacterized protein
VVGNTRSNKQAGKPEGLVLHTSDGGKTWNHREPAESQHRYDRVFFSNRSNGWLVGENIIYRTTDSGLSWRTVLKVPLLQ